MSPRYKQIMFVPPLLELEEITLLNLESKGLLSKYYNLLVDGSSLSRVEKLNAWKIDIQEDIDEIEWNNACLKAQKQPLIQDLTYFSTNG